MATERLGHRSDEADFAGCAIGKAVLARGLAALVGYLHERPAGVDAPVDLRGGDNEGARPVAGRRHRGIVDKKGPLSGVPREKNKKSELLLPLCPRAEEGSL